MTKENLDSIDRKLTRLLKLTDRSLSPEGTKRELV